MFLKEWKGGVMLAQAAFILFIFLFMLVKVDLYMLEIVIYSCDGKSEFSAAITPVFSVT